MPQQSGMLHDNISLTAPNGERIYEDMDALNEDVKMTVAEHFGDDIPFKVTSIKYTDVYDGYFAVITYQLENGVTSNYAVSNSMSVFEKTPVDEFIIEYRASDVQLGHSDDGEIAIMYINSGDDHKTVYKCNSASNCTPCKVIQKRITTQDPIKPDKTTIVTSCSTECTDCKLTATTIIYH